MGRKRGLEYRSLIMAALLIASSLTAPVLVAEAVRSSNPNIIIIYADDLGYGDLSCYNAKCVYSTPRLDQMAREGVRFTDAHSPSTICSPSRYGLFSGQQIYRSTGRGGVAFEGPGGPSILKPATPVFPAAEFRGATQAGPRGDFVFELDALMGRVIDLVKELEIDDNTLILFNSDNGSETVHVDWMRSDFQHDPCGGWRGMKRDGWEGGHRVPFIARWPKHIPASVVSKQMTNTTDIFATLASVVGFELPDDTARDSFDMLPVMLGVQDESQSIRPLLVPLHHRQPSTRIIP